MNVSGLRGSHLTTPRFHKMETISMTIALAQLEVTSDKEQNIARAVATIQEAKKSGADVVCLPDLINCPGYEIDDFESYAEEVPRGRTCSALKQAAKDKGICVVGGSLLEKFDGDHYNTCTVWDDNGYLLGKLRENTSKRLDMDDPSKKTMRFEHNGVKMGVGLNCNVESSSMDDIMSKLSGSSIAFFPGARKMTSNSDCWDFLNKVRLASHRMWIGLVSRESNCAKLVDCWGKEQKEQKGAGMLLYKLEVQQRVEEPERPQCFLM